MKIYTHIVGSMTTGAIDIEDFFEYIGDTALCCGATPAQDVAQAGQASVFAQLTNQAQQVFGASSQVFQQLQKTFAPTVAAGPSQQGFSPAENANLQSQAITQSGQAYRNAKAAVGNAGASEGGGNNPALQTGVNAGTDAKLASSASENTANELSNITEKNYETGRANYDTAVSGLESSPNVFNPATSAGGAATGAGEASATTANQIASQNNSWVQAVTGALGGVASAATGGVIKNLGGGGSGSGGSSGGSSFVPGVTGITDGGA